MAGHVEKCDGAQTWHYGLVARWWAEFNRADPDELAFHQGFIEGNGQPALDLGCGTGRLLVPLLLAGLDVDGCDVSADMLAHCQRLAARSGLAPTLYQQAFHELDLPRTYRTIYICDSFGIGGLRAQDAEALRRCYRHLAPGGALVFSHDLPYANASHWSYWLANGRHGLPEVWPESGTRKRTADGDELELRARLVTFDPLEQTTTRQIRVTLVRDGQRVMEEEHTLRTTEYFRNELMLMLAQTGFADVEVRGGYSEAPATAADTTVVVVAHTAA